MGIHYNKGAELLDFCEKNKEDFNMEGGFFKPLMKPGLGVEIDEARVIELSKKMRRTGEIRCGGMRMDLSPNGKCASYFALVRRWLHFSYPGHILLYASRGCEKFAAFPQHELFSASQHRY